MVVTSEVSLVEYIGDGVVTSWNFGFLIYDAKHLKVYLRAPNEAWTLRETNYTVFLGPGNPQTGYNGGSVEMVVEDGTQVRLLRQVPLVQTGINLRRSSGFDPLAVMREADLAVMRDQEINRKASQINDFELVHEAAVAAGLLATTKAAEAAASALSVDGNFIVTSAGIAEVTTIYVEVAGSDAADGLTPGAAVASIARAVDLARFYILRQPGKQWRILFGAGVWSPSATVRLRWMPQSLYPLIFEGAVDGLNVPLSILDGSNLAGGDTDFFRNHDFQSSRFFVEFRNLKFRNISGMGFWLTDANVQTFNLHGSNIGAVLGHVRDSYLRVRGGRVENCGTGYFGHSSTGRIGSSVGAIPSATDRVSFAGCGTAIDVSRQSNIYVADCAFSGSLFCDIEIGYNARIRTQGNVFGVRAPGSVGAMRSVLNSIRTMDPAYPDTYLDASPGRPAVVTLEGGIDDFRFGQWKASSRHVNNIYNGDPIVYTGGARQLLSDATIAMRPLLLPGYFFFNREARAIVELDVQVGANTFFGLELSGESSANGAVAARLDLGAGQADTVARVGKIVLEVNGPRPSDDRLWGIGRIDLNNLVNDTQYNLAGAATNAYFAAATPGQIAWRLYLTLSGTAPALTVYGMRSYVEY